VNHAAEILTQVLLLIAVAVVGLVALGYWLGRTGERDRARRGRGGSSEPPAAGEDPDG
jgi:hypothetical protein